MLTRLSVLSVLLGTITSVFASENLMIERQEEHTSLSHLYELLSIEEKELPMFDRIVSFLHRHEASFRVLEHEAEGQSDKIASIRGNDPKQSAKAILTMSTPPKGECSYQLVVLPGDQALDFGKLKKLVGIKNTSMAPLDHVESLTRCVRGSVPPFSFNPQISLIVDQSLINNNQEIVFNAGRLDRSIFLNVKDYIKIVQPRLVDIIRVNK